MPKKPHVPPPERLPSHSKGEHFLIGIRYQRRNARRFVIEEQRTHVWLDKKRSLRRRRALHTTIEQHTHTHEAYRTNGRFQWSGYWPLKLLPGGNMVRAFAKHRRRRAFARPPVSAGPPTSKPSARPLCSCPRRPPEAPQQGLGVRPNAGREQGDPNS